MGSRKMHSKKKRAGKAQPHKQKLCVLILYHKLGEELVEVE